MPKMKVWGALALLACIAVPAAAAAPAPALKPPAPVSPWIAPGDEAILRAVFDALDQRRYEVAEVLRAELGGAAARSVADWAYYRSGVEGPSAEDYAAFLSAHPGWPDENRIQGKAEALFDNETPPAQILSFFAGRDPVTGGGALQLARALIEEGRAEAGTARLRAAWIDHDWSAAEERSILSRFGAGLTEADHIAKVDRQLFDIRATDTTRLLPLLPAKARREAQARIAFLRMEGGARALYDALPADSQRDSGVLHAATRYHRRRDEDWTATRYAGMAPVEAAGLRDPAAWYREKRLLARTAIKERRFRDAYVLSAYSALPPSADFAEAEFMAGWMALRFLKDPARAKAHFTYLTTRVSSPISLSRGYYWLGRAHEAMGERQAAKAHYRVAAAYPFAFYGQLAAEALGEDAPGTLFPSKEEPGADALTTFGARPMVRAMRILAEIGEDWAFDRFARAVDDRLTDPAEVIAYADLVGGERKTYLAVRAGKVARSNGASVPQVTFPMIAVPEEVERYVERPLVLGLSRQESEFNPRAYSSARAQGLMQLLSSTARITARKEGIPFDGSRLMDDPSYNLVLGAAHLSHLIERFEGSYVMTLAGYNAGPHRVDSWIETYGDPRDPAVDVIDWVELIPFSETRNYVMRVLENVQTYRARLYGGPIAGRLGYDLTRGVDRPRPFGADESAAALIEVSAEAAITQDALNMPGSAPSAVGAYQAFPPLHEAPVQ